MSAPADFVVPHRALQRYILADEKIIIATHRHWGMLWEPILTAAAAFVLALALLVAVDPNVRDDMGWVWLPFVVLGGRLLYKWLEWRARWFVMTDRRLLLLDGFLVHRVAMMPSEKVTDLGYERTPMGQLLGYGTFIFETAGQDQALDRVTWVPRPDARYRLIIASLFHPDAADAEAAAQANPDIRPQAVPSMDSPSGPPPPALMPRIGRRSNPPTQRIELPVARGGAAPGSTADANPAGEGEEPTGPSWSSTGSATAPTTPGSATSGTTGTGTASSSGAPSAGRTSDGRHGDHVPGGATTAADSSEVRPEPFIEGGKDPKIR
ncbi:PH domain-containing protein [Promicromonospora iranensis]|uniref:PH domain-containing protein n=1 Tax=Promicromonospora iranensis TaxID=1105144 RepID=UPI0023A9FB93|nr:PH domain-containing protein [Promicromonospora iranensis]